jgi:8-oxo-dGTP pyrophosphatase MutT (NUDIX family)
LKHPLRRTDIEFVLRETLAERPRREIIELGQSVASAVLVGLFERDDDIRVWLAKRPETMRTHRGQVAFPGGKRDANDATLRHTAAREAFEEIQLAEADIEWIGVLDDFVTGTGFVITPHVAWVNPQFTPIANEAEVARVFHAPLRAFLARGSGTFPRIGIDVDGEWVWGATFAMARGLATLLSSALDQQRT